MIFFYKIKKILPLTTATTATTATNRIKISEIFIFEISKISKEENVGFFVKLKWNHFLKLFQLEQVFFPFHFSLIKLFPSSLTVKQNKLECLSLKFFQASLIFTRKAKSGHTLWVDFICSTSLSSFITRKFISSQKIISRDKHSSLFAPPSATYFDDRIIQSILGTDHHTIISKLLTSVLRFFLKCGYLTYQKYILKRYDSIQIRRKYREFDRNNFLWIPNVDS